MADFETVTLTGTYLPCVACCAPIIFSSPTPRRISVSGNADAPRITPHTAECTMGMTPEPLLDMTVEIPLTEVDPQLRALLWGQPPYGEEASDG